MMFATTGRAQGALLQKVVVAMVWIHPKDETTFVLFRLGMTGMGLATSGAVAFWVLSRWKVQGVIRWMHR